MSRPCTDGDRRVCGGGQRGHCGLVYGIKVSSIYSRVSDINQRDRVITDWRPTDNAPQLVPVVVDKLVVGLGEDLTVNLGQVERRRFLHVVILNGAHGR